MVRSLMISLFLASWLVIPGRGDEPPKGFEPLFNNKDLTGWKATGKMEVWGAEKGVLFVQGGGGGWLMTEKEYADYELRLATMMKREMPIEEELERWYALWDAPL